MESLTEWLSVTGGLCWLVCFWWMQRISARQDALLCELRDQTQRIEALSKEEHKLIKEVHPAVNEIRDEVGQVVDSVKTVAS
jgi:hypothetical protein